MKSFKELSNQAPRSVMYIKPALATVKRRLSNSGTQTQKLVDKWSTLLEVSRKCSAMV